MSTLPKTLTTIVAMSLDDANQSFDPEVRGSILLTGFYILGAIVNLITCLILYPVAWLLSRLLSLVDIVLFRPLLVILRTLAIPFIVVRNLVYAILSIPFRIFDKFENLLTYLFFAILLGSLAGLTLWILSTFTTRFLGIDAESTAKHSDQQSKRQAARSVAQFRADRQEKKKALQQQTMHPKQGSLGSIRRPRVSLSSSALGTSTMKGGYVSAGMVSPTGVGSGSGKVSEQTILEEDDSSSGTYEY